MKIHCLYDALIEPEKLSAHPKNRNKHPEEQIQRLAKIIGYQGWRYAVKVSKQSKFVTSGHGRIEAAKLLKCKVPVVYQDYDSDAQEYADVQADNAIASWAELDLSEINMDLPDFGPDFDIDHLGIKDFVLDPAEKIPLCDEDELPSLKTEAKTKLGDVYVMGKHRLMCGDSTIVTDVEKLMNGKRASLISTDPPYGINYVEIGKEKNQAQAYEDIANDELEDEALKEFIFSMISTAISSALAPNFAFYMWHAMKMQAYFSQAAAAAAAAGILFHRQIVWVKPNFVFGRGQYHWRHELCLMGWLKGNAPPFYGERNQSTIWEAGKENDKIHPTQKPVKLFEIPILNHTKANEYIYEPFAGSGSNFIAAEKHNRACYGMELSPHYCDAIVARWEKMSGEKAKLISHV